MSELARHLMPAEVKRQVTCDLDRGVPSRSQGYVSVTPQDEAGRKCAAWQAHHYEVFAYPMVLDAPLEPIAEVLRGLPGASGLRIRTAEEYARDAQSRVRPQRPGVYVSLPARS